ncbi:hypothetical protein DIU31_009460 [Mucilaginibacter rubeus]|uniref:Uncharacterized protein n=1 Tax=Mucilaginibacter rubeus TaxID=2027860 RepID=A0AAE6JEB0_9SPHI|nr:MULTISPECIES: hypothetical protein [Mucilaginibacter]QEM03728.1 hypothetical protein DIU31_009460 [Mucilaginibacter rubeus]QEM16339.1 hypothetical protein DIU38_009555 [Mucilaginibacter gossypii]QTE40895.1 hypothetical protein J3L19_18205 [Mucilaginibacter rubeus]QTE47498.1 hypothetical protein J3L21_18180 [Mucilaginibacter rubeus]QTE58890.1 hypothetical protein J3L23_09845 [Mucilaginibacter rubeus]
MSTTTKNSGTTQGAATPKNDSKKIETTNRPSIPGKDNEKNDGLVKNDPAKTEPAAQAAQAASTPATETKASANEQPATGHEQPKAEEVKEQPAGEIKFLKPALNLEQTVKYVEGLHRKNIQRLALIARIKTLEDFQIKLAENADQLESNFYQGCKLIIEDDKGNKFTTNTPNLIAMTAQFVYDACVSKLSEIEAEIVFPN